MAKLISVRSLRYGLFGLADLGLTEALPDFDPNDHPATFFESTAIILAQSEIDGPVSIAVCIDEPIVELGATPYRYGKGALLISSGRLGVFSESSDDAEAVQVSPGRYSVTIYADEINNPSRLLGVLHISDNLVT